jgi:anti-sigma factor RsiW
MQHLTEEVLVAHYYHDDDAPPAAEEHLRACGECRAQYHAIRRVLALVQEAPLPDRGDAYGDQVWSRLRWKLGSDKRRRLRWQSLLAAAAVLAIAFFAGQLWHARSSSSTIALPPRSNR